MIRTVLNFIKHRSKLVIAFIFFSFSIFFFTFCLIGVIVYPIFNSLYESFLGYKKYSSNNALINDVSNQNNSKEENKIDNFYTKIHQNSNLFESNITKLVENTYKSVVTVVYEKRNNLINILDDNVSAVGTGFFISEDGLLITNQHVICDANSSEVTIVTHDNKSYRVESINIDPNQDIAILKIKNTNNEKFSFLKFANPGLKPKVGEDVIAIGNPFGDNPGTVTRGIISGLNRNVNASGFCGNNLDYKFYEGVIQTDAAINSGNSGGPLINMNGEVIGVNSAGLLGAENISYAIPHTTILKILQRFLKYGKIVTPFLGVSHRMIDSFVDKRSGVKYPSGALILSVSPNSPAAQAGILPGDIIVKIGNYKVEFSLVTTLNLNFEPGQETVLTVFRLDKDTEIGNYKDIKINVGERIYESR